MILKAKKKLAKARIFARRLRALPNKQARTAAEHRVRAFQASSTGATALRTPDVGRKAEINTPGVKL